VKTVSHTFLHKFHMTSAGTTRVSALRTLTAIAAKLR